MPDARIFRFLKNSAEIIRFAVMKHVRYPQSPRNVDNLLHERRIDLQHETAQFWRNRIQVIEAFLRRRKHLRKVFARTDAAKRLSWFVRQRFQGPGGYAPMPTSGAPIRSTG